MAGQDRPQQILSWDKRARDREQWWSRASARGAACCDHQQPRRHRLGRRAAPRPCWLMSIVPGCWGGAGRVRRGEADEAKSLAARVKGMRKSAPTWRTSWGGLLRRPRRWTGGEAAVRRSGGSGWRFTGAVQIGRVWRLDVPGCFQHPSGRVPQLEVTHLVSHFWARTGPRIGRKSTVRKRTDARRCSRAKGNNIKHRVLD